MNWYDFAIYDHSLAILVKTLIYEQFMPTSKMADGKLKLFWLNIETWERLSAYDIAFLVFVNYPVQIPIKSVQIHLSFVLCVIVPAWQ